MKFQLLSTDKFQGLKVDMHLWTIDLFQGQVGALLKGLEKGRCQRCVMDKNQGLTAGSQQGVQTDKCQFRIPAIDMIQGLVSQRSLLDRCYPGMRIFPLFPFDKQLIERIFNIYLHRFCVPNHLTRKYFRFQYQMISFCFELINKRKLVKVAHALSPQP